MAESLLAASKLCTIEAVLGTPVMCELLGSILSREEIGVDTRASLLIRVRDPQDGEAWCTFFDIYAPLIMHWCRRPGLNEQDAEDVTQNVLKSVASAIPNFEYRPEKGMFRGWLLTAVRREIARHCEKKRIHGGIAGDQQSILDSLPSDDAESGEWMDELTGHVYRTALERVKPEFDERQWTAFELVWNQQQPAKTVAEQLGVSTGWVYKAKFNVIQRLKEEVRFIAEDLPVFS
jgi:RNA polymerase sigma-70 factor (ECF subfamily)